MPRDRPVELRPADLKLGFDCGEDEAGVLEIDHLLGQRDATLGERHRLVENQMRCGLRGNRDRQAFLRQVADQIDEPAIYLADDVVHRHADIVEEKFGGVDRPMADLVEVATAREPGAIRLD